jgi:hypothetical protein
MTRNVVNLKFNKTGLILSTVLTGESEDDWYGYSPRERCLFGRKPMEMAYPKKDWTLTGEPTNNAEGSW